MKTLKAASIPLATLLVLSLAVLPAAAATPAERDHPVELDRFYAQKPVWGPCGEGFPPAMTCTSITVPLDYRNPRGRTISVAVSKLPAARPDLRHGVLLFNPGGPGGPGLGLPADLADYLPDVRDRFDLIGFDPRSVGRSTPMTCGLTATEVNYLFPPQQSFAADVRQQAGIAAKCARANGPDLRFTNTRNTARDMDVIRGALGERTLSYLGYSYGTYLGSVYTQMFGRHADRIVLDSSVDPATVWHGLTRPIARELERALTRWAAWTAARNDVFGVGATAAAVRSRFDAVRAGALHTPVPVDDWKLGEQPLSAIAFRVMYDDRLYLALSDLMRVVVNGGRLLPEVHRYLNYLITTPFTSDNYTAAQLTIFCDDAAWPRELARYRWEKARDGRRYPFFGARAATVKPCTFWRYRPIEPPTRIGPGNRAPSILMVQSEGDIATPYDGALRLHGLLRNSRMVTLRGAQVHGVFPVYFDDCVNTTATRYLVTGELPAADVTCVHTPEVAAHLLAAAGLPPRALW